MKIKKSILAVSAGMTLALSSCSTFSLVNSQVYNDANLSDFHTFRIITPGEGKLPPGMEMVTYYNIAAAIREQMVERGYVEDPSSPIVVNIGLTVKKEVSTAPISTFTNPTPPPPPAPVIVPVPAPAGPPSGNHGPNPDADLSQAFQHPGPIGNRPGPAPGPAPAPMHWFPYLGPAPAPAFSPFFMYPRSNYWNSNVQVVTGIYREGVLTMDIVDVANHMALYSASVATILENGDAQFRNLSGIAEAVKTLFKKYPVPLLPQYQNQKN